MTATTLFYIIIGMIILNFIIEKVLDALNAKHYNDPIPNELDDVYDAEAYKKSQEYKATNYKFIICFILNFEYCISYKVIKNFDNFFNYEMIQTWFN